MAVNLLQLQGILKGRKAPCAQYAGLEHLLDELLLSSLRGSQVFRLLLELPMEPSKFLLGNDPCP